MDVAEFHSQGTADYFTYERGADLIRDWTTNWLPGLVQTRAYAAALLRGLGHDKQTASAKVAHRMARQREVLARSEVRLILDEAVLHREVGGPEVMRGQLTALLDMPVSVSLRVVPFTVGAHRGMDGPFVLLDGPCGGVLYLENFAHDRTLVGGPLRAAYEGVWSALEAVAEPGGPVVDAALERLTTRRP